MTEADRAYWEREYIASEFESGITTHLEWMEFVWGDKHIYEVEFACTTSYGYDPRNASEIILDEALQGYFDGIG